MIYKLSCQSRLLSQKLNQDTMIYFVILTFKHEERFIITFVLFIQEKILMIDTTQDRYV